MAILYVFIFTFVVIRNSCVDANLLDPERRCVPTSIVRGPCHTCMCTTEGVYHCRVEPCNRTLLDAEPIITSVKDCEPNFMYRVDTLICSCSKNGFWKSFGCNNMFRFIQKYVRKPDAAALRSFELQQTVECISEKLYLIGCNICQCSKNGTILASSCTNRTCNNGSKADICKFGQYLRTTNELCACSDINYYIDRLCFQVIDNPVQRVASNDVDSIIDIDKSWKKTSRRSFTEELCDKDAVYNKDCNKCFCIHGKLSCTDKICIPLRIRKKVLNLDYKMRSEDCKPGDVNCDLSSSVNSLSLKAAHQPNVTKTKFQDLPEIKDGDTCVEGEVYKMDCNTCQCLKNNALLCTKMACLNIAQMKKVLQLKKKSKRTKEKTVMEKNCVPGKIYEQQGCQKCFCNNFNVVVCSNRTCEDQRQLIESPLDIGPALDDNEFDKLPSLPNAATKCKPGKTYRVLCNICMCLANGNLLCENKLCLSTDDVNRIRAIKESGQPCKSYNETIASCVKCICHKNVQQCDPISDCVSQSVRRALHGEHKKIKPRISLDLEHDKCIPNMIYKINCNNCYCQSDHTLRCTKKGCLNYQQVNLLLKQKKKLLALNGNY